MNLRGMSSMHVIQTSIDIPTHHAGMPKRSFVHICRWSFNSKCKHLVLGHTNAAKENAMIAVLFESNPHPDQKESYLAAGSRLGPLAEAMDGFLGIERFESMTNPGKMMAISYWRDEESVRQWRNLEIHRRIQNNSRERIFANYRLRVAKIIRDYSMHDRDQAPADSKTAHGQ